MKCHDRSISSLGCDMKTNYSYYYYLRQRRLCNARCLSV